MITRIAAAFLIFAICSASVSFGVDRVTVESLSVPVGASDVTIGISIANDDSISAIVIPLEIRSLDSGAYITDTFACVPQSRLASYLLAHTATRYFPRRNAVQSWRCNGSGYDTSGAIDFVSPDGFYYAGVRTEQSGMPAGDDDTLGSSLILNFDVTATYGVFEIDTTCIAPANHLFFMGCDAMCNGYTPSFVKGVIHIGGPLWTADTIAGTLSNSVSLYKDVRLTGDLLIDTGVTLKILPGVTVTAERLEGSLCEILVYGELLIDTTTISFPRFESEVDTAGTWQGIRVMPGGHLKISSGAIIEDAVVGITIDTAVVPDTIKNCAISNCSYYGILSFNSSVPIINNSIVDIPDGDGIFIMDCDPLIKGNVITNCEQGISVVRSSSLIRDNLIEGTGGIYGILVNQDDELYPGLDTLRLVNDSVYGYFTQAHLQTSYKGHCSIDSCSFIAEYEVGAQSPKCIGAAQGAWVRVRNSRIRDFGGYGFYSYKSKADLGRTSSSGNNSIYSDGSVDTCEECLNLCYYVRHVQSTSTDTLKAENNWWDANPPSSARFTGLVDRSPCLSSEPLPKLRPTALEPDGADIPREFSIEQNYPNPFNPATTISFSIPQTSKVTISIYNVLGQLVAEVAKGEFPAGEHRVGWDGTNAEGLQQASGVYFYTVTAGAFSESKKMVLLK